MELRHLEHFVAVAEEGSFTRAAGRVHLVQSALSVSVRSLERELGARLFERTTHTVALTDAGSALLAQARRTLEAAQRARDVVAEVQGVVRGTLRLGLMQSLTLVDVAGLLTRFHRLHPGVEIRPRPAAGGSAALAEGVRRGELDLAFVSLGGHRVPGIATTVLATEPILLVSAKGQFGEAKEKVALEELAGASFVDFPVGWGTRAAVDRCFAAAGLEREVAVEVADVTTFVELVRAGLGLGFLPRSLLRPGERRLTVRAVVPSPSWEVVLAVPKERLPSAAARAFLDLVSATLEPANVGVQV